MDRKVRILALAGSARKASFNKKLVALAAQAARDAGADVTVVDLKDYPLPIYDGDCEAAEGMPDNGKKLKQLFIDHDGLLFACPEYNSSISPLLKNVIDWVSRPAPGEPGLVAFQGKAAGLLSASPGALGGLRGLVHVRSILGNIGVLVLPVQMAISKAHEAFAEDGSLKDPKQLETVRKVGTSLVDVLKKLKA